MDEFLAIVVAIILVSVGMFLLLALPMVLLGLLGLLIVVFVLLSPWIVYGSIQGWRDARDARRRR